MNQAGMQLFDFDCCADFLELSLDGLSLVLGNSFLKGSGSAVNQSLCFLQAKTCELADNLDDLDLLCASSSKDNVELSLLFSSRSSTASRNSLFMSARQ